MPDLNPTAIYIGGVSGTHRAEQLYFQNDGTTPLVAPYDAFLTMSANGVVLGTYFAAAGTLLSDASKWSGPQAALIAANYAGNATHATDADFSKLLFSAILGLTYSNAQTIVVKIQALKGGEFSQNSGPFLQMGINSSIGSLDFPLDIDVRNYALIKKGTFVHSSQYEVEGTANQGVVDIQDTVSRQSKNRIITDTGETLGGTYARYFADTFSPTGFSVIWNRSNSTLPVRLNTYRSTIKAFDSDGFPIYGTAQNINAPGPPGTQGDAFSGHAIVEALFSGGMPVIIIMKTPSTKTGSILINTGTPAVPDYSTFIRTDAIEASNEGLTIPRSDSNGKIYAARGTTAVVGQFNRMTYNGANDNAAALATVGNWSFERLADIGTTSPAANGDGATFQGKPYGCAINEDLIVNGEPTIYVTDDTNHILWKVTHNGGVAGDETDWDWLIIVGQTGVAGNTNGIGTIATLNGPRGIDYESGFLYLSNRLSHTIRKIDTTTLDVTTYFGIVGVASQVQQFNF